MASSNFLLFDENQTNIQTDDQYASDGDRINGMKQGLSRSILFNKVLFQSSAMVKALSTLMVNRGFDAIDNNQSTLVDSLNQAFPISRGLPVGILIPTTLPLTKAPKGFLFPDGKTFDPTEYPELAEKYQIGVDTYYYGQEQVNGVWFPKTPDLRAAFIRCLDWEKGKDPNHVLGTPQDDAFQGHTHSFTASNFVAGTDGALFNTYRRSGSTGVGEAETSTYGDVRVSTETRPYNFALPFLIIAESGFNTNISQETLSYIQVSLTLDKDDWSSNLQTLSVTGVSSTSRIDMGLPTPTTQSNALAFSNAGIFISSIGDGDITFTCLREPTSDINLVIKIWSE